MAQVIGSAIVTVSTFVVALAVMYAVNAMGLLRVSPKARLYGLDLHEHGISAYPEYVISSVASPAALVVQQGDKAVISGDIAHERDHWDRGLSSQDRETGKIRQIRIDGFCLPN